MSCFQKQIVTQKELMNCLDTLVDGRREVTKNISLFLCQPNLARTGSLRGAETNWLLPQSVPLCTIILYCFYTVTNVTGAPCPAWRGSAKRTATANELW